MCGIAGVIDWRQPVDQASVKKMTDAIPHRGPDDAGIEVLAGGHVCIAHRRLSILDLSPLGHQPMSGAGGRVWIVFNGEIYNFREIRNELEASGAVFRSDSDTEVILAAYERWGLKAVERLRGMFAFALWDDRDRTLHLCRDRFGVKPLYYAAQGSRLAFASELRALNVAGLTAKRVSADSVAEFLQYGYVSSDRSIFDDVQAVPPGAVMSFAADKQPVVSIYWSATQLYNAESTRALRRELSTLSDDALLDKVENSLTEAFRYRMVADVPVGLFLSGGIDSSCVATVLARRAGVRLRTFTIGYGDNEFDETPFAREVATQLGSEHTELILSEQDALDVVQLLPDLVDEPIGDSSFIPTYLVSKMARQHVTVALSADGADELFGGYARYDVCGRFVRRQGTPLGALYFLAGNVLDVLPQGLMSSAYAISRRGQQQFAGINDKIRKFARMARARGRFEAYDAAVSERSAREVADLISGKASQASAARNAFSAVDTREPAEQFMHFDTVRYLPGDLLTKVDRASMAVSLEAREPFLDHRMAELAVALPLNWKIRDGQNKYALRRILGRHLDARLFDRPKKGFSVPIGKWLRGALRGVVHDELSESSVRRVGILDSRAVQLALRDFMSGGRKTSPASIWFLFQLQQWGRKWL